MALEAINEIKEAEKKAEKIISEANQDAKEIISNATKEAEIKYNDSRNTDGEWWTDDLLLRQFPRCGEQNGIEYRDFLQDRE